MTNQQLATATDNEAMFTALQNSLYPGATRESVAMVISYCQASGVDPMTKPVHLVPMSVKVPGTRDKYEWRDVIMPGIELYRTKAHRTGDYSGQDEPEFGETISRFDMQFPAWCKVTVYRTVHGERVPYSAKVFWLETYATAGKKTDAPNSMWRKRPFGQLEKCAEALALRKAFPEEIGAQPTMEEMAGKTIDGTVVDVTDDEDDIMPKAKALTTQNADEDAPRKAEPTAEKKSGKIHADLSASQVRILMTKAERAGLGSDNDLTDKFGDITPSNINDVLKQLTDLAK